MKEIKELVKSLIRKHKTRSPFEICNNLKINVVFSSELPNKVNGLYLNSSDYGKIILINSSLKMNKRDKVCAHELGHAILHSDINSINYHQNFDGDLAEFEMEADMFSFFLIDEIDLDFGD